MSMFDKINERDSESFQQTFIDDFVGRNASTGTIDAKQNAQEYADILKVESYETLFETDTELVCRD